MRLPSPLAAFGLGLALMAASRPVCAQSGTASMQVLVEVSNIQISIAPLSQLHFGDVIPGAPRTIDPRTSVSAGKFEIRGARRAEFTLSMTLPAELRAGAGPNAMPIAFGAAAGCYDQRDRQNSCTTYDPATTLIARIRPTPPPNNTMYVWLGGTVTPGGTQVPGSYLAVVTASVAYTGN
ncbi:MAG: hypothetical protein IH616_14485 [Gemmatimonadales bacterium]|jgi:hypothetical protein|nr:hypothetical protein [Gemmatimonadales bacterium]